MTTCKTMSRAIKHTGRAKVLPLRAGLERLTEAREPPTDKVFRDGSIPALVHVPLSKAHM